MILLNFDWKFISELAFPAFTGLGGWFLKTYFEKKPLLIAYYGHIAALSTTDTDGKKFPVFSHSVIIKNNGKLVSKNIRIRHCHLPNSFEIHPPVPYFVVDLERGYKEIVIAQLIPKQQITISYLYFPPVDYSKIHDGILSDEGYAKVIDMIPVPQLKKWQQWIAYILLFVGGLTCLGWLYKLGLFILSKEYLSSIIGGNNLRV